MQGDNGSVEMDGIEDHGGLRMIGKSCVICGSVRDKNGQYCRDCWRAMGKRYDVPAIRALGRMDITVTQKRRCASCRILPKCVEANSVYDGCNTIFKSLQGREVKAKIRSLVGRVSG